MSHFHTSKDGANRKAPCVKLDKLAKVRVTPQPKGLIELIEYSYQQVATYFPEADFERTPKLSVLGLEQFRDG